MAEEQFVESHLSLYKLQGIHGSKIIWPLHKVEILYIFQEEINLHILKIVCSNHPHPLIFSISI